MKRARESGAAYRKKRKEREESLKQNEGAILKYIRSIETTTEATEVNESKSLSDSSDSSSSDLSTSTASSNEKDEEEKPGPAVYTVNLKDVGLWPRNISNDTRIFMVGQGASLVQNLDSDSGEMIGNGVCVYQRKN